MPQPAPLAAGAAAPPSPLVGEVAALAPSAPPSVPDPGFEAHAAARRMSDKARTKVRIGADAAALFAFGPTSCALVSPDASSVVA